MYPALVLARYPPSRSLERLPVLGCVSFAGFSISFAAPGLPFLTLAEDVFYIGHRAEFPVGHLLECLHNIVGSFVLAGVLGELAGIHWEVRAFEPMRQIGRGCSCHLYLLYRLGFS